MPIKLVIAVTDKDWFDTLRRRDDLEEVNFWAPSDSSFKALTPGELFLFKLHAPYNLIVGGGVFSHATSMPTSLAWEAFGLANGATSLAEMRSRISRYRKSDPGDRSDFPIGCRILTQPFFFDEPDWIAPPPSWSPNIVKFKTYSTEASEGLSLWNTVTDRLNTPSGLSEGEDEPRFGKPKLIPPRLGQGAFRLLVTDIYTRRCAVTHERTLPALEAAHIQPYGEGGKHKATNGLLLRRDIHSLFDRGYVTVTPDMRFEVSKQIREEFENGRHYYALHGEHVFTPKSTEHRPDPALLKWHNEECFKG